MLDAFLQSEGISIINVALRLIYCAASNHGMNSGGRRAVEKP
jgi:hypothetical protein